MHYLTAIMFEFIHYANIVIIRKMKEVGLLQYLQPTIRYLFVHNILYCMMFFNAAGCHSKRKVIRN